MTPIGFAVALFCVALPVSIAGLNITAALLTLLLVLGALSREKIHWEALRAPAFYALGLYLAAAVASGLAGLDPGHSFQFINKDFHKLWLFALLLLALSKAPSPQAHRPLAIGFGFMALVGVVQSATLRTPGHLWVRASGFVHAVTYGEQMALAVLGGLCLLGRAEAGTDDAKSRRWGAALVVLLSAALILSQTRGAFLGLAAGFIAVCFFDAVLRRRALWALAALVAGVVLLEALPTGRSLSGSFQTWGKPGDQFSPHFHRLVLWKAAWGMFLDHPVFGVGPSNYGLAFTRYFQGTLEGQSVWSSAHNLYVHQLAERGAAGLAALLAFLGALSARAVQRARVNPNAWNLWAVGSMAAFLVMNMTETALQNEQFMTLALFIWTWAEANNDLPASIQRR